MTGADIPTPEFSFLVDPAELGDKEAVYRLEATPSQRAALAERFSLVSIDAFRADAALRWIRRGKVLRLTGRIEADVEQKCVVTLEPFPVHVAEEVDIVYSRDVAHSAEVDIAGLDDVEPLPDGPLDIGEVLTEEMALALDPFPRKPGVEFVDESWGDAETPGQASDNKKKSSPFEVLVTLRRKD